MENVEERHDISDAQWALEACAFARPARAMGRDCERQPQVHQRGVLGFARWRPLEGLAVEIRQVGHRVPALLQVARQWAVEQDL